MPSIVGLDFEKRQISICQFTICQFDCVCNPFSNRSFGKIMVSPDGDKKPCSLFSEGFCLVQVTFQSSNRTE